jgi:hypothetical protein
MNQREGEYKSPHPGDQHLLQRVSLCVVQKRVKKLVQQQRADLLVLKRADLLVLKKALAVP